MRCSMGMAHGNERGSFCESFVHLCYKWRNYYVRMSKDVALYHHERF